MSWLGQFSATLAALLAGAYLWRVVDVVRLRSGLWLLGYAHRLRVRRWEAEAARGYADFGRRPAGAVDATEADRA